MTRTIAPEHEVVANLRLTTSRCVLHIFLFGERLILSECAKLTKC
jgi:hypothetical protein